MCDRYDTEGRLLMTADEWKRTSRDYKGKIDGKPTVLRLLPNGATGEVFVNIIGRKEA